MEAIDEDELRRMARELNYETTTLVGQVIALYSGIFVHGTPVYMALVEAPLVHLRLLDEFCWRTTPTIRKGQKGDDVYASLYLDGWESDGFLDKETERDPINAQLQHLLSRRANGYQWRLGDLLASCAGELLRFIRDHDEKHPQRLDWFGPSREVLEPVEYGYEGLLGHFDTHGS